MKIDDWDWEDPDYEDRPDRLADISNPEDVLNWETEKI